LGFSDPDSRNAQQTSRKWIKVGSDCPNRDYYGKTDDKSFELAQKYVDHVSKYV